VNSTGSSLTPPPPHPHNPRTTLTPSHPHLDTPLSHQELGRLQATLEAALARVKAVQKDRALRLAAVLCLRCRASLRAVALLPCRHMCLCGPCSEDMGVPLIASPGPAGVGVGGGVPGPLTPSTAPAAAAAAPTVTQQAAVPATAGHGNAGGSDGRGGDGDPAVGSHGHHDSGCGGCGADGGAGDSELEVGKEVEVLEEEVDVTGDGIASSDPGGSALSPTPRSGTAGPGAAAAAAPPTCPTCPVCSAVVTGRVALR
jgi:hypothetical protein